MTKTNDSAALPFGSTAERVKPTVRKAGTNASVALAPSVEDRLAELTRQLETERAARIEAETKAAVLAKTQKGTTHETFDPCAITLKVKDTGTIVLGMGGGFGMYGVIAAYPDGMFRLEKLLRSEPARARILAFVDANREKFKAMHAAYETKKPEIQAAAAVRRAAQRAGQAEAEQE